MHLKGFSIADLGDRILLYFSLSVSGLIKRRRRIMDQPANVDVFAGEEEVTPRLPSPVQLPAVPFVDPIISEGGHVSGGPGIIDDDIAGAANASHAVTFQQPHDDIIPWCPPSHTGPRRSTRKRNPAVYYEASPRVSAAAAAKKPRQRTSSKKRSQSRKKKVTMNSSVTAQNAAAASSAATATPSSSSKRKKKASRPRRLFAKHETPAMNTSFGHGHGSAHTGHNAAHPYAHSTPMHHRSPKSSRVVARRRLTHSGGGGYSARRTPRYRSIGGGGGGGVGSMNIPKQFLVTIEPVKKH